MQAPKTASHVERRRRTQRPRRPSGRARSRCSPRVLRRGDPGVASGTQSRNDAIGGPSRPWCVDAIKVRVADQERRCDLFGRGWVGKTLFSHDLDTRIVDLDPRFERLVSLVCDIEGSIVKDEPDFAFSAQSLAQQIGCRDAHGGKVIGH